MEKIQSPKFAYYIFTYDTGALVFLDYTKKEKLTQCEIEAPVALAFIPHKSRELIVIADAMLLFADNKLVARARKYIKRLDARNCTVWADSDCYPDGYLSTLIDHYMKPDDRDAIDYNERISCHLRALRTDMRLQAEEALADKLTYDLKP